MKTSRNYDRLFKQKVVFEVLSGTITKEEARRRYNIGGKSTVLDWMREFAGLKMRDAESDPLPILHSMDQNEDKTELEEKVKRLEAKLEYAELKGRAYQIMVRIAKEQYNLDLEKKFGAKPSKDSKKSGQD